MEAVEITGTDVRCDLCPTSEALPDEPTSLLPDGWTFTHQVDGLTCCPDCSLKTHHVVVQGVGLHVVGIYESRRVAGMCAASIDGGKVITIGPADLEGNE